MAPIQTNQRMGRALKWNRSLKLPVEPTTSTRDESTLGSIAQFVRASAEKARFARYKRNVGAREGIRSSVGGKGNVRRQSIGNPDSESDNDDISESEDELDGGASETDDESDGAISDAEDEDGDLDPDNGNLPPTPTRDAVPTLTLNPPGVGIATTALPTTETPADVVVVSPTSLVDPTMVTMTPIVPTAVESSGIPFTTLSTAPLARITNQPQKGVVQDDRPPPAVTLPTLPLPSLETTSSSSIPSTTTTQTLSSPEASKLPAEEEPEIEDNFDADDWREMMRPPPPPSRALSESAEHALIAVGSIGAFILFCFISWMVYRTMKRFRGGGSNDFDDKFTTWKRKDSSGTLIVPGQTSPVDENADRDVSATQDYFATEKPRPGSLRRTGTSGSKGSTRKANLAGGYRPEPQVPQSPALELPMGIRIPDTPGSQPPVLPTPVSDTSEAARRQLPTYRESQLSSLSSGFGDGDLVAPQPLTAPPPAVAPGPAPMRDDYAAGARASVRESWLSRGDSRRETVYTQSSEDRPVRFRSINSWVNQQTGRVQRAGSRARERGEVPVMPAIPGQLNVTQQTVYR